MQDSDSITVVQWQYCGSTGSTKICLGNNSAPNAEIVRPPSLLNAHHSNLSSPPPLTNGFNLGTAQMPDPEATLRPRFGRISRQCDMRCFRVSHLISHSRPRVIISAFPLVRILWPRVLPVMARVPHTSA